MKIKILLTLVAVGVLVGGYFLIKSGPNIFTCGFDEFVGSWSGFPMAVEIGSSEHRQWVGTAPLTTEPMIQLYLPAQHRCAYSKDLKYTIDFGDGTTETLFDSKNGMSSFTTTHYLKHTYTKVGFYRMVVSIPATRPVDGDVKEFGADISMVAVLPTTNIPAPIIQFMKTEPSPKEVPYLSYCLSPSGKPFYLVITRTERDPATIPKNDHSELTTDLHYHEFDPSGNAITSQSQEICVNLSNYTK